jgi:hypothetical protein
LQFLDAGVGLVGGVVRNYRHSAKGEANVTVDELREVLLKVANEYDKLMTENAALKAVIQSVAPRPGEPDLQKQVSDLIKDAKNTPQLRDVQRQYDNLRWQIQQAAEDRQLFELLRRFPLGGDAN